MRGKAETRTALGYTPPHPRSPHEFGHRPVYLANGQSIDDRTEIIGYRRRNGCVALVGRIAIHPRVSDTRRRVTVGTGIAVVVRLPGGASYKSVNVTVKLPSTDALNSSLAYTDGITRGVGFVIENSGRLECTVGLEGKEGIVGVPCPAHEVVSKSRSSIRIGGVEVTH